MTAREYPRVPARGFPVDGKFIFKAPLRAYPEKYSRVLAGTRGPLRGGL